MTVARYVPEPDDVSGDTELPGMIGRHPSMRAVYRLVRRVAPTDLPVVIEGETGTGKELVARALHALSPRSRGPFVDVNCAAIAETLVEAELFGWERGAFTGAHQRGLGLLEVADGGTLLLDEACSLPLAIQAKLLRAVERHGFRRVGGRSLIRSDFRLVLTVSRPVQELCKAGEFRQDFAFRVAEITVGLPPLRWRGGDVRLLAERLLEATSRNAGRPLRWHEDALVQLEEHRWPGNVRELSALVRRLAVLATQDLVGPEQLAAADFPVQCRVTAEQLKAALEAAGGNFSRAAREVGIPRTTMRSRLFPKRAGSRTG